MGKQLSQFLSQHSPTNKTNVKQLKTPFTRVIALQFHGILRYLGLLYNVYVHAAITLPYYTLSRFIQRSLRLTTHCLCSCSDHFDLLYIVCVHAAITWTYYTLSMFMQRSLVIRWQTLLLVSTTTSTASRRRVSTTTRAK